MVGHAAWAKPRAWAGRRHPAEQRRSLVDDARRRGALHRIARAGASDRAVESPDLGAAIARVIPAANLALRLLVSYVASSLDLEALVAPELTQLGVMHVYDLLAVALGAREADDVAKGRGSRAARLNAIKADILAHLGERDLSLGAVAARHDNLAGLRAQAVRERRLVVLRIRARRAARARAFAS